MNSITTATEQPHARETVPGTGQVRARAVARRLALVEGRRQLTHPFVWLGFALTTASFLNAQRYVPVLHRDVPPLANYSLPLLVGVLLTAYLAGSRPARHGTEELFGPAPASRATRTLGLLLALPWAFVIGTIWTLVAIAILYAKGGVGVPFAADVVQPILLVTFGAALGTALGVWLPKPVSVVVALSVLGGIQLLLTQGEGGVAHTFAPLLQGNVWRLPEITIRPVGWHDVYLVGLVGLVAVIALVRDGVTLRRAGAGLAAFAITTVGAAGQLAAKPTFAEIDELLAFAEDPPLVCEHRAPVEVCTLDRYRGLAAYWASPVEDVLSFAPERIGGSVAMRIEQQLETWQILETMRDWYAQQAAVDFEHQRRFGDQDLTGPFVPDRYRPTEVGLETHTHWIPSRDAIVIALETSRRIVGIPNGESSTYTWTDDDLATLEEFGYLLIPSADEAGAPAPPEPGTTVEVIEQCWLAGQAREVIAIWLAAESSPNHADRLREIVETRGLFDEQIDNGVGSVDLLTEQHDLHSNAAVAWSKVGADVAAQLLEIPDAKDRIFADWSRWTDHATTTDELATAFGLRSPQPRSDFGDPYEADIHGPTNPEGEVAPLPRPLRREVSTCPAKA